MKLTIVIEMNNAAFEESPTGETWRILRALATAILNNGFTPLEGKGGYKIYDINGNACGAAKLRKD